MKRTLLFIILSIILTLSLAACAETDVVGQEAVTSFDKVLDALEDRVTADEETGGWALTSPDGSERFFWSRDYSAGAQYDVFIEFDAQPFIDAGLDTAKLPAGTLTAGRIVLGADLGDDALTYNGEAAPLASFEKIVELYRDRIGYHTALDHYGVKLGGGNMFEWAKDMGTNDIDIVFVVDPGIFIEAGADPARVEGWAFAKVQLEEDGKPVEADKFLKPFNLQ